MQSHVSAIIIGQQQLKLAEIVLCKLFNCDGFISKGIYYTMHHMHLISIFISYSWLEISSNIVVRARDQTAEMARLFD